MQMPSAHAHPVGILRVGQAPEARLGLDARRSAPSIAGVLGVLFGLLFWKLGDGLPRVPPASRNGRRAVALGGVRASSSVSSTSGSGRSRSSIRSPSRTRATTRSRPSGSRATPTLARLRAHLEPHFLLNTLNAIAGLVTDDPRAARRLLAGARRSAARRDARGRDAARSGAEVEWLQRYAPILEARYDGAIAFKWDVDPPAIGASRCRGFFSSRSSRTRSSTARSRRGEGGEVVRERRPRRRRGQMLRCTISDNGPGHRRASARSGAFGLDSGSAASVAQGSAREPRDRFVARRHARHGRMAVDWVQS